ncbi:MAG: hypothetical protein AUK00_00910 [Dehalococcoidia bacterium CG2_30_46_9]|nr:MAG: hypothetical protein AUK00_00910 [Dehalococcoidia bacterium CG2_30_46_9]
MTFSLDNNMPRIVSLLSRFSRSKPWMVNIGYTSFSCLLDKTYRQSLLCGEIFLNFFSKYLLFEKSLLPYRAMSQFTNVEE